MKDKKIKTNNVDNKAHVEKSYSNHRIRMKERFARNGFKGFNDYEVLEFLLYYIFPRFDTKPRAKALLKKFGCFSKVMDASIEEIAKVEGMGIQSAISFKGLRNALSFYFEDLAYNNSIQISDVKSLLKFIKAVIGDKPNEVLYIIFLNSKKEIIDSKIIAEGTVNQTVAFPRRIAEDALKLEATGVILAHNHPNGHCSPSEDDILLTQEINSALTLIDVSLIEHIIISDLDYFSFFENGIIS